MCGCCHGHGCGGGYGYAPYFGADRRFGPGRPTRDESVDDLEEYKETLEAEIRRLEKRIGSLRGKGAPA